MPSRSDLVQTVREAPNLVVPSGAELEATAIDEWLERYPDQDFSLVDAVSFTVMKSRKIDEVLSLDHHFPSAGFRTTPR